MKILKINKEDFNGVIKKIIKLINQEKIIVFPTDTVYGLIGNAKSKTVVKRIFKIKKRFFQKPIPIFVKDLKMAKRLVRINKTQEEILKEFWPGKLTIVLRAKSTPKWWSRLGVLSKERKIGLRIPNYKILNILLKKINFPLTATSANISGKKATTKIKEVLNQFKNKKSQPDLIVDAGDLEPSLPSTVIDLETLEILREGAISKKEILDKIKLCK